MLHRTQSVVPLPMPLLVHSADTPLGAYDDTRLADAPLDDHSDPQLADTSLVSGADAPLGAPTDAR